MPPLAPPISPGFRNFPRLPDLNQVHDIAAARSGTQLIVDRDIRVLPTGLIARIPILLQI